MTRQQIPTYERREAEYKAYATPEYKVTMPDGSKTTVNSVEQAEKVVESGGSVDAARKGWE